MIARFDNKELSPLIEGCKRNELDSQQRLYKHFYSFAMGKCLRYANNRYEAAEILNDGFLKVFRSIEKYNYSWPFHSWLGKIMTNTAIDRYRSELKHAQTQELTVAEEIGQDPTIFQSINYQDLLKMVQRLPVSYRTVFNMFAIDGYSHEEIANKLGISTGTSKSHLFKARHKLQAALKKEVADDQKRAVEGGRVVSIKKNNFPPLNMRMN